MTRAKPELTDELIQTARERLKEHGGRKYVEPAGSSLAGQERLYLRYDIGQAAIDAMIDCRFNPSHIGKPLELRDQIVQALQSGYASEQD